MLKKPNLKSLTKLIACSAIVSIYGTSVFFQPPSYAASKEERKQAYQARLIKQQERLKTLEKEKEKNPSLYISTLDRIAYTYRKLNQIEKCNQTRKKLIDFYLHCDRSTVNRSASRDVISNLNDLRKQISPQELEKRLKSLLEIFEKLKLEKKRKFWIGRTIDIIDYIGKSTNPQKHIELYEYWLELRKKTLGAKSIENDFILAKLSRINKESGNTEKSKAYRLKRENLDQPNYKKAEFQIENAFWHLYRGELKLYKADWKKAGDLVGWDFSKCRTHYLDRMFRRYQELGMQDEAEELLLLLFKHPIRAQLSHFDSFLENDINLYIKSANLSKATKLLKERVLAGRRLSPPDPANFWKFTLYRIQYITNKVKGNKAPIDKTLDGLDLFATPQTRVKLNNLALTKRGNRSGINILFLNGYQFQATRISKSGTFRFAKPFLSNYQKTEYLQSFQIRERLENWVNSLPLWFILNDQRLKEYLDTSTIPKVTAQENTKAKKTYQRYRKLVQNK